MASQNEFIIDNQFLIEQCAAGEVNDGSSTSDSAKQTAANNVQCSSCSDGAIATSWCVDCSEYICDSCVQAHQRLKITKDHTIKPKEEANNEQLPGAAGIDKLHMCNLHTQEKLSLFCETCDKLTCRDCQLSDHRDHKYKFAHEIATETRHALSTLVSEINYKRFLLTSATKVIDDRQQLIADKKKELIKEITAMVVKITNTVNMRGKNLVMRLNEVCDSKMKVLIEKKDALQLLSDNTDHCIEFMASALEKGSDYAILSSKKSLVRHLQKLKCQRADIPNPEIPVRIQVQLNQVSELQKGIKIASYDFEAYIYFCTYSYCSIGHCNCGWQTISTHTNGKWSATSAAQPEYGSPLKTWLGTWYSLWHVSQWTAWSFWSTTCWSHV